MTTVVEDLLLITSVGRGAVEDGSLARLFRSLSQVSCPVPVTLVVGNRSGATISTSLPESIQLIEVALPQSFGLSASRNALLGVARSRDLLRPGTVVNFPDDDSWFLPDEDALGAAVAAILAGADVVVGRFAPSAVSCDTRRFPLQPADPLAPGRLCIVANSVSMFWAASALDRVGPFDEHLGAGTPLHSSEDLDLLLRAVAGGLTVRYDPGVCIGHLYGSSKASQYFVGNVAALRKNAPALPLLWLLLVRRILGGFRRLPSGGVSQRDLATALALALRGPRRLSFISDVQP